MTEAQDYVMAALTAIGAIPDNLAYIDGDLFIIGMRKGEWFLTSHDTGDEISDYCSLASKIRAGVERHDYWVTTLYQDVEDTEKGLKID